MTTQKDAYYFPHFSNARHDRKIRRVLKELGVEGYGIYFMLLEVLREQSDLRYPIADIDLLADEFRTSEAKIQTIISKYDLFEIDQEEMFFSPKQIKYLQPYFERSQRARDAANKRWDAQKQLPQTCDGNANALQKQSDGNASKVKYSKVNKVNGIGITHTAKEFYTNEIEMNADGSLIDLYTQAAEYIQKQAVLPKMERQLTYKGFATCYNKAKEHGYRVGDILKKMENWKDGAKDVSKKNKCMSQTIQNWINNDAKRSGKIHK